MAAKHVHFGATARERMLAGVDTLADAAKLSSTLEEMEEYNRYDVLSLEELVFILAPFSNQIPNLDMYHDDEENHCFCGSTEWEQDGFAYTNLSKFARFKCTSCGAERRDRINLLPKSKRKSLKMNVT